MNELERAGLNPIDIITVKHIEKDYLKNSVAVSRLITKAYNNGFRSGVEECKKFIDCHNKGVKYK